MTVIVSTEKEVIFNVSKFIIIKFLLVLFSYLINNIADGQNFVNAIKLDPSPSA